MSPLNCMENYDRSHGMIGYAKKEVHIDNSELLIEADIRDIAYVHLFNKDEIHSFTRPITNFGDDLKQFGYWTNDKR